MIKRLIVMIEIDQEAMEKQPSMSPSEFISHSFENQTDDIIIRGWHYIDEESPIDELNILSRLGK